MIEVIDKILDFLKDHLPGLLVAIGVGYKIGKGKTRKLEIRAAQSELENALFKNKEIVRHNNDGLSANDIIDDAIRKGSKMPDGDGSGGPGEV